MEWFISLYRRESSGRVQIFTARTIEICLQRPEQLTCKISLHWVSLATATVVHVETLYYLVLRHNGPEDSTFQSKELRPGLRHCA